MKIVRLVFGLLLVPAIAFGQVPQETFDSARFSAGVLSDLKKEYGRDKTYPPQYETQILIALSYYPELRDTPIQFRIRKKHTPLATRSSWSGLLKRRERRDYVITISDRTEDMLMPLLLHNLPFNAQIGVIGHELGHVVEFSSMLASRIVKHAIRTVSSAYVDHFEYRTDSICIAHGLGYQLLDWSHYVRKAMHKNNWDGADNVHKPMIRERYMNPATIRRRIDQLKMYRRARGQVWPNV